uniref:MRH domain-containing protein n=1 Tax=Chlamydomonas euryale TaxID=1486919 RepID=A0A7R9VH33_9CHLO|mmetsp:Transcript_34230/g.101731  ORF Transcript_34230/g.101731 Transcript_34230/m.101731 type:complete len:198 (+) Transcript_34230:949-1542(+)
MAASRKLSETSKLVETLTKELEELRREQRNLERYATPPGQPPFDFGPGDVLLPLAGRCVSDTASAAGWTYEVCMFDSAHQALKYRPQQRTLLGHWVGFEDGHATAVFGGGDDCGGHGPRHMRVLLECGATESLHSATEPHTCEYTATLSTPLLCTRDELHRAHAELANAVKARDALAQQIAREVAERVDPDDPKKEL